MTTTNCPQCGRAYLVDPERGDEGCPMRCKPVYGPSPLRAIYPTLRALIEIERRVFGSRHSENQS